MSSLRSPRRGRKPYRCPVEKSSGKTCGRQLPRGGRTRTGSPWRPSSKNRSKDPVEPEEREQSRDQQRERGRRGEKRRDLGLLLLHDEARVQRPVDLLQVAR